MRTQVAAKASHPEPDHEKTQEFGHDHIVDPSTMLMEEFEVERMVRFGEQDCQSREGAQKHSGRWVGTP